MTADHERAVRLLAAAYLVALTDEQLAAYVVALEDLDPDDVHVAVVDLLRTPARFMPRPGEVRQAVARLDDDEPPDPGLAWNEVLGEIRRVGRYSEPDFTHPLIGRAVDAIGGWAAVCNSTNPVADRAQFLRAFERLAERAQRERLTACGLGRGVLAALPGVFAALPEGDDD